MKSTKLLFLGICTLLLVGCGKKAEKEAMLPEQSDRWVQSVTLSEESVVKFIGKNKEWIVTQTSTVKNVENLKEIKIGDEINGVYIGAIRCSFFQKDASNGNEKYMWRGRWGCQAGRSEHEVKFAVKEDGTKIFDYIYVRPISIDKDHQK